MLVTTSDDVPGREIAETLGLVTANTVRSRNVGRDILASLKTITGGEIHTYTQLLTESRGQALSQLEAKAAAEGADAIIALRMTTSSVMQGASEILVYGTAVKLR